ncbi:MAG: hypothetical protein Ct9H90mP14_4080 [Methanobacteriota archaeon]|nr:MAG: hypothetical protein Ct9H90mP14_4080 [Euryarchaeota archaeon]
MFGFQRVNDQIWAAADARARGFLMGATAGRTTLNGEGLQHQDGHSLLHASTVPSCRAWDPAYAYELATIIQHGIDEMWGKDKDIFHYIMLYNQNEQQPPKPKGIDADLMRGAYLFSEAADGEGPVIRLLGSGPILSHVERRLKFDRIWSKVRSLVSTFLWGTRRAGLQRRGQPDLTLKTLNQHLFQSVLVMM